MNYANSPLPNGPTIGDLYETAHHAMDVATKIMRDFGLASRGATSKGERDYVTEVDQAIEYSVKRFLSESIPSIPFLGEETGGADPHHGRCWVLDPIDGTVNFMRGNPLCGISLALLEEGTATIGVVEFPFMGERYAAQSGVGAFLNGEPLSPLQGSRVEESVVAFGDFSVGVARASRNAISIGLINQFSNDVLRVRMVGTAAAQLAWLAAGRVDISVTLSNKAWDVQAGILIVREAGGCVFDLNGQDHTLDSCFTLAASENLKPYLIEIFGRPEIADYLHSVA